MTRLPGRLVVRAAALLGATVGSACVPTRAWERPAFGGSVHRGSTPVANATITWRTLSPTDASVATSSASSPTNARGEFAIRGQRKWTVGMILPADALVRWRVELESRGQTTVLWQQELVTPGRSTTPGRVVIDCDLTQADPCVLTDTDHPRLQPLGKRLPQR